MILFTYLVKYFTIIIYILDCSVCFLRLAVVLWMDYGYAEVVDWLLSKFWNSEVLAGKR